MQTLKIKLVGEKEYREVPNVENMNVLDSGVLVIDSEGETILFAQGYCLAANIV